MRGFVTLASIIPGVSTTVTIAIAALVVALIIGVVAFFLFRGSGKKKAGEAPPVGASDWQRQQAGGQPAPWGQQNQQQAPWGGQQPGAQPGWGDMAQQQQPAGWGMPAGQQQQQAGWGTPSSPQQPAAGWGTPAAQQPTGWDAAAQQPAAGWGAPTAQPQPGGWDAQNQQNQQQPAGWGAPSTQQQNNWGAPSSPQQPAAGWGAPAAQQQGGWGNQGAGGQQPWDQQQVATPQPQAQDPWSQQQQQQQAWGAQNNQQQAPTAYGGSGSGQGWGAMGQAQAAPGVDAWGQPGQQPQQGNWPGAMGAGQQPVSPPPGSNQAQPAWQQAGYPQGQQGYGTGFESPDGDRTILGPAGARGPVPQGRTGVVRIEEGKEPGRVYEVRKESLSIGRSRESDIFLEDLAVSRLHASIISMGNGNYALRDEGSANGTKVNGQAVNKYQPYPLQEGDKIQLGQTVLVFARR